MVCLKTKRVVYYLLITWMVVAAVGCGQKGNLYWPDERQASKTKAEP